METDFVRWLKSVLPNSDALKIGIGDDAALLRLDTPDLIVTSDLICDTVHFLSDQVAPEAIGRKAMAVNLSDLAAMAAKPIAATVALLLPRNAGSEYAKRLILGMLPLMEEFELAIAGGDTNSWDGKLAIEVTLFGQPHAQGVLKRSTAQVGDAIFVTGRLGGSILGHHLSFTPRLREIEHLFSNHPLTAGMDITDGLLLDLSRLCEASEAGAVLNLSDVPVSDAAHQVAKESTKEPLRHALCDGEDFEILFTAPAEVADSLGSGLKFPGAPTLEISRIGHVIETLGVWSQTGDQRTLIEVAGYQHRF